jgi:hypothetical protein
MPTDLLNDYNRPKSDCRLFSHATGICEILELSAMYEMLPFVCRKTKHSFTNTTQPPSALRYVYYAKDHNIKNNNIAVCFVQTWEVVSEISRRNIDYSIRKQSAEENAGKD